MKVSLIERLLSTRGGRLKNLKKRVISFLSSIPKEKISNEQSRVLEYLIHNEITVFPYPFVNEYLSLEINLKYDQTEDLLYTLFDGKKLFYKNGSQKNKAKKYFKAILIEQDKRSPHRYLSENFNVNENDVVVDVGAAEGNFTLSVIEKVKHVYLFEPDKNWVKALEATFKPWKEKVTIVNKFISNITDESKQTVSLDDFFDKKIINFLKADVEGFEMRLLKGGKKIIDANKQLKIAICTYHNQEDAEQIQEILRNQNFNCDFSNGYMLYYYGRSNVVKEPYLRRAILRAEKSETTSS